MSASCQREHESTLCECVVILIIAATNLELRSQLHSVVDIAHLGRDLPLVRSGRREIEISTDSIATIHPARVRLERNAIGFGLKSRHKSATSHTRMHIVRAMLNVLQEVFEASNEAVLTGGS